MKKSLYMVRILNNKLWGKLKMKRNYSNSYLKNTDGFMDVPENDWLIACQKMLTFIVLCSPCRQKEAEVGLVVILFLFECLDRGNSRWRCENH